MAKPIHWVRAPLTGRARPIVAQQGHRPGTGGGDNNRRVNRPDGRIDTHHPVTVDPHCRHCGFRANLAAHALRGGQKASDALVAVGIPRTGLICGCRHTVDSEIRRQPRYIFRRYDTSVNAIPPQHRDPLTQGILAIARLKPQVPGRLEAR